ncbi:MAG: DMT family transporter [Chloroflexi bacterium]|nr:DMT family transporter [Ardenticatenaceae bacterium]MBL1130713.1 DMT family transporter [Chloroflexota bacterium]NOG36806.1 DMT family transporter [Chloroflexota bacterium]GIK57869.1 MAG: transporter [Chloroflexota bacterium]
MPPSPPEPTAVNPRQWRHGLVWALLSPLFLGIVPIFAKMAYGAGAGVLTVVTFRTLFATAVIWLTMLLFRRHLIRSSAFAIAGSMVAGGINGIGSLFFYASLNRIDASLGQLINITYLVFVTLLLRLAGQAVSRLTLFRLGLILLAIYLLTMGSLGEPDWLGVGMMLFAALTYAIQLVFSQRIMLDIPAPTMTLYAVSAMALVVTTTWLLFPSDMVLVTAVGWQAIFFMGLATALSRLTLFLGVKRLGSMQAALLGVLEVLVTVIIAIIWLGEQLTAVQWLGALLILISILLVRYERGVPKRVDWWHVFWRWLRRGT